MKKLLLCIFVISFALSSCSKQEEESSSNGLNYDKLIIGKWDVDGWLELTFNSDNTIIQYVSGSTYKDGSWNIYGRHIDIAFDNYYSGIGGGYSGTIRELNSDNFVMVVTNTSSGNSNQWNGHRIN